MLAWTELPPLPDARGFAGSYAGISDGKLLVAGGANFPDKPHAEGGTKVWTDRAFVLDSPTGTWRELPDKLPKPLGYGVSLTTPEGVLCIGGSDVKQHFTDVFLLKLVDGKLTRVEYPPLPGPCANSCGALAGNVAYVAGGLESPAATKTMHTFWRLDLAKPAAERRWEALDPWPGPARMLATAGVIDGRFYLCGGTDLSAGSDGKPVRTYLRDAYSYHNGAWSRIADLPRAAVACPSPAAVAAGKLLLFSGDDGAKVNLPLAEQTGFPNDTLAFDPSANRWSVADTMPAPFVVTPLVPWQNGHVIPGGEIRPGVRSNRIFLGKHSP